MKEWLTAAGFLFHGFVAAVRPSLSTHQVSLIKTDVWKVEKKDVETSIEGVSAQKDIVLALVSHLHNCFHLSLLGLEVTVGQRH